MFWNKKEERKLPELPPIQSPFTKELIQTSTQEEEEEDFGSLEKHSLPSFPDSPIKKGFSQAAIKDAVSNPEEVQPNEPNQSSIKTIEMEVDEEASPSISSKSQKSSKASALKLGPPPEEDKKESEAEEMESIPMPSQGKKKPGSADIFVKIEKFHSAKKTLESAEHQIDLMDDLLKKIRETKLREEQELAAWEKEISSTKAKIQNVTETIFEKTE